MKMVKSLLLGACIGVLAATGAYATAGPKAMPQAQAHATKAPQPGQSSPYSIVNITFGYVDDQSNSAGADIGPCVLVKSVPVSASSSLEEHSGIDGGTVLSTPAPS